MGTTLSAIQANNGVALQTTAVIEGIPWILTDGDPSLANAAYAASSSIADFGTLNGGRGGLSVSWDMEQRASPWKPFMEPSVVRFSVVPATTHSAPTTISDAVGETVFKRTGGTETHIIANLDCNDTTITCQRVDDFSAVGYLYAGPELLHTSARDTGADTFTADIRGACAPFATDIGVRFARTHRPAAAGEYMIQPRIGTEPRTWVGRWCAIWLHKKNGTTSIDTPNHDQSGAHLAFAGRIVSVEDSDGATIFTCEDVRRKIYETVLLRDQFRAKVGEGHRLVTGDAWTIKTVRNNTTSGNANPLTVVASGASGANQINAGTYTVDQIATKWNEWFQSERAAGRILFNLRYHGIVEVADGLRGRLDVSDPTTTASQSRRVRISATNGSGANSCYIAIGCLGWDFSIDETDNDPSWDRTSDRPPSRVSIGVFDTLLQTMPIQNATGSWVSQSALLPAGLQNQSCDGIVKIGSLGYLRARYTSNTSIELSGSGLAQWFPGDEVRGIYPTYEEDAPDLEQVLLIDHPFQSLLLKILFSTGTSGFNHATYDVLSEQLGCAIPYTIAGSGFVTDVGSVAEPDLPCSMLIDKPTRLGELLEPDFLLRRCFFAWGAGRLNLKTWATPTSSYATFTLNETTKATPSGTVDTNRAAVREDDNFFNLIKINYNLATDGTFSNSLRLIDASSIRDHGERARTINMRSTYARSSPSPIEALLATFAGFFNYTSRPWLVIRRSIDFNMFEQTIPGTVASVTDKYLRDPATGRRYSNTLATGGLSGFPGMVIAQRFDWGGTEVGRDGAPAVVRPPAGEVEIMLSPQRTLTTYVPCAQVDDTAANAGYNAGTKVLTTYAHEHSESSEANDNTNFQAGDEVLVVEMDPQTAASPLSWSDVVATVGTNTLTLTTGLGGWDTTKKYRVIYDAYGTVGATQQAKCYQADDADGLIVDTAQAYALGFFGSSQSTTVTLSDGTEVPSRHATVAYGDGKPLDVGYERDAARLANNLLHYKYARQAPTAWSEVRDFTGSGTWQLVEVRPIFLGQASMLSRTRHLSVAPRLRSTSGATAEVRITLARQRPVGSTRDDVTRVAPYESQTFTTTSTTFSVPTAATLTIQHCNIRPGLLGGVGWLYVEIKTATEYTGLGRCVLGPLVST